MTATMNLGTGRRKTAVARVRITPGAGAFQVNEHPLDQYFDTDEERRRARQPLVDAALVGSYDVHARVHGGGKNGQADAVRLGLARALKDAAPVAFPALRGAGHLTRDQRAKERKHYGRRGARRGFQWCKR
jgi:small subunit ribosomal protein S9